VAVQRHPDRSHEKDDDVAFRSATVLLLPVCRDRYRCNEHLARCRGALLALSGMWARLAAEPGRAKGFQSPCGSGRSTQIDSGRQAPSGDL